MASEQGMSGIDTRAVASELSEKLPLWIDQVYQFDSHTMGIRLNGENKARYLLIIEAGRRAHLVKNLPEPPKNPPQFAMLLRKYLAGGKVLAVRQHGLERILIFDIGKGKALFRLIIELFDDGNIVLANEQYEIIKPLRHHRFKDREVVPRVPYVMSLTDPTASPVSFATVLKNDGRDLVRALAIGCMLGGSYAEYLCKQAGLDKTMPAAQADPAPLYTALRALLDDVKHARVPVITQKHCEPVDLTGEGGERHFLSFSEALEAFFPLTKAAEKIREAKPKLSKEERIKKYQKNAIKKFDEKIEKTEALVAAIYENYAFVSRLITSLDAASRRLSWQEIEKHLQGTASPDAQKIVAFHPAEAAVDIDIGKVVRIHVHESLEENAGRYHDIIKKFRKKKAGALAAMAAAPVKKSLQKREFVPLKKLWYHRFRWFVTSDGVVVLGGRDASQNEELVRKYMAGGDLFTHADVHGASVVIAKGKTARMDEVAQFAASYSGAWKSGHFSADVFCALPSQVSKTPESGEFVSRGSFIVRGERTWYRNVPLAVGIGLMLEPNAAVIGGPPSAIRQRAAAYVGLVPGQYEPNDVAKKVLRILKEKFSDMEQKALKNILNTEAVAAFVPPGGSDIARGDHEG
jgi:predicted ribosome quality control (RQC) complex YloA/Tae2 family protein